VYLSYFSIEGMIARRVRRRYQLQDADKEIGEHWTLKDEALDRPLWRTGLRGGGGFGFGTAVGKNGGGGRKFFGRV